MRIITGVRKPDLTGGGCWALVRRHTGKLWAQSTSCGCKARPGMLTCRHHAKYESSAQKAALSTHSGEKAAPDALTAAARDVLAERQRQVNAEGWTPEHDDTHSDGSLACAASCYACAAAGLDDAERDWPWDGGFKHAHPRRMLVKAGALILAEIERLDRAAAPVGDGGEAE